MEVSRPMHFDQNLGNSDALTDRDLGSQQFVHVRCLATREVRVKGYERYSARFRAAAAFFLTLISSSASAIVSSIKLERVKPFSKQWRLRLSEFFASK